MRDVPERRRERLDLFIGRRCLVVRSTGTMGSKGRQVSTHIAYYDVPGEQWRTLCGRKLELAEPTGEEISRVVCAKCSPYVAEVKQMQDPVGGFSASS